MNTMPTGLGLEGGLPIQLARTTVMRRMIPWLLVIPMLAPGRFALSAQEPPPGSSTSAPVRADFSQVPLAFQVNQGQFDPEVKFACRAGRSTTYFTSTETVLVLRKALSGVQHLPGSPLGPGQRVQALEEALEAAAPPAVIRLSLDGSNPESQPSPLDRLSARFNYMRSSDPSAWRFDVPAYRAVRYVGIYPGVDLVCQGQSQQLKYDFTVRPGGEVASIRLRVKGADSVTLDDHGNLVLRTSADDVVLPAPVIYQESASVRTPVAGRYVLLEDGLVGFEVGAYDRSTPLIIDPILVSSTYLGGAGVDNAIGVATDSAGFAYICGYTESSNFPTAGPIQGTSAGAADAFVAKIDLANNVLVYSTYLGGSGIDIAESIALDASGRAYVAGITGSGNFPTQGGVQATFGGQLDGFVARISPGGNALEYSTYLGGDKIDYAWGVGVDGAGNTYVTGRTYSASFPLQSPLQSTLKGTSDAFVAKISASGSSLAFSTLVGGTGEEEARNVAVASSGNISVALWTTSTDFPTANPIQGTFGGAVDAAVITLNSTGSALLFSTYLGGPDGDSAEAIKVDSSGNLYIAGYAGVLFPTTNAIQSVYGGAQDALVAKLNPASRTVVFATYLGGNQRDWAHGLAIDASGNVLVSGETISTNFPMQDALQATYGGGVVDGFVCKVSASGSSLVYSTYLGGSGIDGSNSVAVDPTGRAVVIGVTDSANFPIANAIQPTIAGGQDAFLAVIADSPLPPTTTSLAVTDADGVALSGVVLLPNAPGVSDIDASAVGTAVPGATFVVTALDPTQVVSIPAPTITSPSQGLLLTTASPVVSGTASTGGLTITLLVDGVPFGTTVANGAGGWSLTPSTTLPSGTHGLRVFATDASGNSSTLSGVVSVTIDTAGPIVSTDFPLNQTISNLKPTLSGRWSDIVTGVVTNSVMITLQHNGGPVLNITSGAIITTGGFTYVPADPLQAGNYTLSVTAMDVAGLSTTFTLGFTVEATPVDIVRPNIAIVSPDGSPLSATSVSLDALISDSSTGIYLPSVQVALNGVSVGATKSVVSLNSFGTPEIVQVTATLQPLLESNVLRISATDLAGNATSETLTFAASPPPTAATVLAIEMIAGDGQSAVTSQCVQNDLVVRVFDVNSGTPVAGVVVIFEEPSFRLGWPEPSPNGSVVTGTDGRAYARWVLSPVPGVNTVEARIHPENPSRSTSDNFAISSADRVSFSLHGHSPTLADVTVRGPNNICGFLTSEFPGSALSRLFKIQVKDHTGSPIKGAAVHPRISQFEDISPPEVNVGRFLPSQGVTGNDGCATFAFVISPDVLPSSVENTEGGFTMEFSLPFFRDASGKVKTLTIDGKVLHPSTREFGSGEIDYGDPQPGQSQIGVPNRRLATTLKVKNTGRVRYIIIEGEGFFEPGDHGIDEGATGTECGQARSVILQDNKADIKFTMTGGTHALVAINGVTDVFAIGPPEVDFVRHANPSLSAAAINGYGRPLAVSGGTVSLQDAGFRMRVYLPTNFQGTVVGKLKSLDRCGNDLNISNPLGALKIENIQFASVGGNELFSIYEAVGDPFAAIEAGIGDNTASLPAGARFLQLTGMGTVDGEVEITPQQDQGGPGPVIKERPAPRKNARLAQEVVYEVGDIAGIFATSEITTKPGDPGAVGLQFAKGYKWTFFRPGGTPDPPFYSDSHIIYFKLSETVHDVTPGKGTNTFNFITLQVPRGRRGLGAVRVEAVDTNDNPWPNFKPEEAHWRVSCGPKVGPAIDLVTPDPTKPTERIIDPAMLTAGPAATKFKAIVDANLLSALPTGAVPPDSDERSDMKIMTGTETPFTSGRLTSVVQDYKKDVKNGVFATTMGFYRPVNATTITTAVYGTVFFTPFCFNELDKGDFESTLAHEVRHVEMLLAFKGANYPGKTAEQTAFASLEHDLFLEVYKAGAGLPAGGELKYRQAAGRIAIGLEHLEIDFNEVKAFFAGDDTTSSHWNLRQSLLGFGREYMVLMNALKNGVPVTGAANVMIVTKSVRDRLIAHLRKIHGEIPAEATIMRRRHESEVPVNAPGATLFGPQLPLPKTE